MEKIISIILFLLPFLLYTQDLVKDYEPPKIMEGSNLILHTNPGFSYQKYSIHNSGNSDNDSYFHFSAGSSYSKWRFTKKLNYSLFSSLNTVISKYNFLISELKHDLQTGNETNNNTYLDLGLRISGGVSYYFYKNLFYSAAYLDYSHFFSNNRSPDASFDFFPALGIGQLYNASRINEAVNFQQVLLDEKLITGSMPQKTLKKIIELLDRRTYGEFRSKFKDDAEIEFFTRIETALREEGIINGSLGSRTVLKLYQALTNNNFFYFPNYKGFQFQAEANYTAATGNDYNSHNKTVNEIKSVIVSGFYGMPIATKSNVTGAVFFEIPVKADYLEDFYNYEFHSPITLLENRQLGRYSSEIYNVIPSFNAGDYKDQYDYAISSQISFFHILNKTAGINTTLSGSFAKVKGGTNKNSIDFSSSLIYSLLNHFYMTTSAGFHRNYYTDYSFYLNGSFYYYVF